MASNLGKKSVLQICGIDTGGIETLVINLIHGLKDRYDFEMYTNTPKNSENKIKLEQMSVKINYYDDVLKSKTGYVFSLIRHLYNNRYDIIHSHNLFSSGVNMFAGWLTRIPIRIAHAHNSHAEVEYTLWRRIYEFLMRLMMRIFATDMIAASDEAAKFVFGKKSMNNRKTRIIPNGINLDEFNKEKYNPYVILEELELNPSDVHFVTVARFSHEKNHFFLIDTFLEVSRIINNAHLTLVGDGELKAEIAEYVNQKGLKKKVTFTGNRGDVPSILSAMDYFLLPSRGEGYGAVFVEAQAMGLYCFASDAVPRCVDMGNISFISLENPPCQWASKIAQTHYNNKKKVIKPELLQSFSIKSAERKIAEIYSKEFKFINIFTRFLSKFKIQTYNIGIIQSSCQDILDNLSEMKIVWLKHRFKDRFFADPFLLWQDDINYHILAEEFIFWEGKGKITLLTADKKSFSLKEKQTIIEEPYHLSYPFCEEGGKTVLVESCAAGKSFEYHLSEDRRTVLKKELVANVGLIDQTKLKKDGIEWLFATDASSPLSKLNLFYRYTPAQCFIPIESNPIKNDIRTARPAGRFFSYDNKLIRPVQDSENRYGYCIRLMEVLNLDMRGIAEREIACIKSENNPPFNETFHTFNVYENFVIVDGSRDFIRFPMKIIYRLLLLLKQIRIKQ
ncbi:MAG: glycosyltransferase [Caldicoprobacterales bacterium]|jgi:glycosyltransferase involved in cell wall biosynthesis